MSTINSQTARNGYAVTPSDTAANAASGLYIGGAGNVAVTMAGGALLTHVAVPAGTFMPIQVSKVMSTNTTATNIIGYTD